MRSTHTNPTDANPTDANPTQAIPTQVERALPVSGRQAWPYGRRRILHGTRLHRSPGAVVPVACADGHRGGRRVLRPRPASPPRNRRRHRPRACGLEPSAGPAARGHRGVERRFRSGWPGGGPPAPLATVSWRALPASAAPTGSRWGTRPTTGRRPVLMRALQGTGVAGPRRHAGPARPGHPPARVTAA